MSQSPISSPSSPLLAASAPVGTYHEELVQRVSAQRDAFFRRVVVSDAAGQSAMVARIASEVRDMIANDVEHGEKSISTYYPAVVRLARESPFPAMRDTFAQLVLDVEAKFPEYNALRTRHHRVSYFIENSAVEHLDQNPDDDVRALFQRAFQLTGRVSHLVQLLAWHKSYLSLFQDSVASIMVRDGPLPLSWRSYIGAMAASELRCHYLADTSQYYFLVNSGDPEWIKGLDYVSPKLFRLHELSSLLAHRPWLLTPDHIADLLASDQEDSWSVSELVHAIIVLCKHHSMSSIALGLGCAEEEDLAIFSEYGYAVTELEGSLASPGAAFPYGLSVKDGAAARQLDNESSCGSYTELDLAAIERDETILLKRLRHGQEGSETADDDDDDETQELPPPLSTDGETSTLEGDDDVESEELSQQVEEEASGFDVVEDGLDFSPRGSSVEAVHRRRDSLWRFCGGSVIRYADFDVRSDEYSVLHTEDFSWDDHCFSLVKRYFPGEAVRA